MWRQVTIHISDYVHAREDEFHFGGGLTEYVHFLTVGKVRQLAMLQRLLLLLLLLLTPPPPGRLSVVGCRLWVQEVLHDPISFLVEGEEGSVDCSLQWCADAYSDTVLGYANSIRTSDGGAHVDGLKAAVTRTLNRVGRKSKILKVRHLCAWHPPRAGEWG